MSAQPKRTKYRKYFTRRDLPKHSKKPESIRQSDHFALVLSQPGYLHERQVEAARKVIRRRVKKEGKVQVLVFSDVSTTQKPTGSRMGKGKGKVRRWLAAMSAGQSIIKLYGIDAKQGISALKSGAKKIPLNLRILQL